MKQNNHYLVRITDTDGMLTYIYFKGIISYTAEYAAIRFQLFMSKEHIFHET